MEDNARLALYREEMQRLRNALVWLAGAYRQEGGIPLEALENSMIHLPVIERAKLFDQGAEPFEEKPESGPKDPDTGMFDLSHSMIRKGMADEIAMLREQLVRARNLLDEAVALINPNGEEEQDFIERAQGFNRQPVESQVPPGSRWRHNKAGTTYIVVRTCLIEAGAVLAVMYRSEKDDTHWVRPMAEFLDGRFRRLPNG